MREAGSYPVPEPGLDERVCAAKEAIFLALCDVGQAPRRWAAYRRPGVNLAGSGAAAAATWIVRGDGVAATPRLRRGHSVETESRRRRGCDVDIP